MDIWVRIPIIKDFSVEKITAQTQIKTDEVSYLNLNKEQVAQIIGKAGGCVWAIDEYANEGWVPKSMSKINTVIIPHLGIDSSFRATITIKSQMSKFTFSQELDNLCSIDTAEFSQVSWDDKLFVVLEASHRVISTLKIDLLDFQDCPEKCFTLDLKNFKRSSAKITIQLSAEHLSATSSAASAELPSSDQVSAIQKALISGEILRYTCPASASCNQVYQTGKLSITNYRFLFTSGSAYDFVVSVPHYCINSVQINIGQLSVATKDLRVIDYYISQEVMRYVLDKYSELRGMHFCFDYHLAFNSSTDFGWTIYDAEREFTRMGAFDNNCYQKMTLNAEYQFCDTYPCVLFQPVCITAEELAIVANFRSRRRIPTITWIGKNVALFRSSQPCVGVFYARCKEDEEFMAKAGIKYIVDARPKVSARANKVKGKGFEHSAYYATCKMHFMNIPNIHKIRASFESLKNITLREDFFMALHSSKWVSYLHSVLFAGKAGADFIGYQKASVLVHCSDGWDRTSQIVSLAQILIDPFYRTFHGFQILVCKDWLSFGYKFRTRGGNDSESSPIFIQFLDAVSQVLRQNVNDFQFTNEYLLFLAEAVFSGKYGTFMGDCESQLMEYMDKTVSVWKEENSEFFNNQYTSSNTEVLHVKTQVSNLVLWEYFYKWNIN